MKYIRFGVIMDGEGHSFDIIEFPGNKKPLHMFVLHVSFLSNIVVVWITVRRILLFPKTSSVKLDGCITVLVSIWCYNAFSSCDECNTKSRNQPEIRPCCTILSRFVPGHVKWFSAFVNCMEAFSVADSNNAVEPLRSDRITRQYPLLDFPFRICPEKGTRVWGLYKTYAKSHV